MFVNRPLVLRASTAISAALFSSAAPVFRHQVTNPRKTVDPGHSPTKRKGTKWRTAYHWTGGAKQAASYAARRRCSAGKSSTLRKTQKLLRLRAMEQGR